MRASDYELESAYPSDAEIEEMFGEAPDGGEWSRDEYDRWFAELSARLSAEAADGRAAEWDALYAELPF